MTFFFWCLCVRVCACASALGAAGREVPGSPRPGTAPCTPAGSAHGGRPPGGWHTGAAGTVTASLHGRSAPAAPHCHHVPEKTQRLLRRLWLVGVFPSYPPLRRGARGATPGALPPSGCGAVPSWQSPPRCPTPTGAGGGLGPPCPWGRGRSSSRRVLPCPSKAPCEPCGCKAARGPPRGLVVGSRGHITSKSVLWLPPRPPTPFSLPAPLPEQRCSQPPPAPCGVCGEVPPGPWQVPGAIGTFPSRPCSVCPRQSTAAAPCAPGSVGPFASRVPSLRDGLFYREIVQKK